MIVAPIRRVAVIGAGTMGSGIALACAAAGLDVILVDTDPAALARGKDVIATTLSARVARGRMARDAAERQQARIVGTPTLGDVAEADLVVEAVFEDMDVKKRVLAAVDAVLAPGRLLATNTSTLSVTELGRATAHPGRVAGLHFFSPAHVMKLLEVVHGEDTSPEILSVAMQVGSLLGKVAVVARDSFGFIGNRMMLDGYFREAEALLLEGATPAQVDGALERFGFAMGPHRVSDLGGTDVGSRARAELFKREARPDPYFVVADRLTALGRLGQKTGAGFYRYAAGGRDALDDPDVDGIVRALAAERGIARREVGDAEIVERCMLALVNVGAAVLQEGVAASAEDVDLVWTNGYGFPRDLGGPMRYADTLGLPFVAERIGHYHAIHGHYWRPATLLADLAASGASFTSCGKDRP